MLRSTFFFCVWILFSSAGISQTLGPYTLYDRLVSAVHPNGCNPNYVTGWPQDSIWVNFSAGQISTGTFGSSWVDQTGDDLLLETGFHAVNYSVRLMLSGGGFSAAHSVAMADWTYNKNVNWKYLFGSCGFSSTTGRQEYYLPLDFNADFGVSGGTVVTGIEITYLTTSGAPDFAGAYIILPPPPLPETELNFMAEKINAGKVSLTWESPQNINTDRFVIEKSFDGKKWQEFRSEFAVAGKEQFIHVDPKPSIGSSYYRLKLISQSGDIHLSKVREINFIQQLSPVIYPARFKHHITVSNIALPFKYEVMDLSGKHVINQQTSSSEEVNLSILSPGLYLIKIGEGEDQVTRKIIKE